MRKGLSRILALGAAVVAVAGALVWRVVSLLLPGHEARADAVPAAQPLVERTPRAAAYTGAGSIAVALTAPPRCFARSPGGDLWVTGGTEMVRLNAAGREEARIHLEAEATAIAFAPSGEMFLAMANRLEVRDAAGAVVRRFADLDQKAVIVSIAADPRTQDLFLADYGNKVIRRYTRQGRFLATIGEKDETRGIPGFIVPSPYFSIQAPGDGKLYAANPGRHGIEVYGYDGAILGSAYRPSSGIEGFAGCCNPACIFIVEDGILTVEKGVTRVKVVTAEGELVRVVADSGSLDPSFLGNPALVDAEGRVLLLDRTAGEIRLFTRG